MRRGEHEGDHLGGVGVDAQGADHVLVVAGGAQSGADLGAKEPVQDGDDGHGQHNAQDNGNGGLRQAGHVADGREDGALGEDGRVGLAHDAQVDGPQADLR